jgi:hypothetical protein
LKANYVFLNRRDASWRQTRHLNQAVNVGLPLALAFIAALTAIASNGPVSWIVTGMAGGVAILSEPRLGLYLIAAMVGVDGASYDPLTAPLEKLFTPLPGVPLTPVELLIGWTGLAWALRCLAETHIQLPNPATLIASFGLFTLVSFGVLNGKMHGGKYIWEAQALLMLFPVILITSGLLRERRHVIKLLVVLLLCLSIMSVELAWRYLALVRVDPNSTLDQAFSHDGAMLIAILAIAAAATVLWGPNRKAKLWGVVVFILASSVVLASRRRAAVIGIEAGFLALGVTLLLSNWRRFMVLCPIALVLVCMYLGAFWNNQAALGQPARGFKAVFLSAETSERDRGSNDYRVTESRNLWYGIKNGPFIGIGFGLPYPKPYPMPDLTSMWELWDYTPHNTVLWLWLKGGVLALMAFFFLIGTAVSRAVMLARTVRSPVVMVIVGTSLAYLVMAVMFAYVDLGFSSPRIIMMLGITIGLLAAIDRAWPNLNTE